MSKKFRIPFAILIASSFLSGCGNNTSTLLSSSSFSNADSSSVVSSLDSSIVSSLSSKVDDSSKTKTNNTSLYGGYYKDIVSWTNGEDLKNQLYTRLRNGYTPLNYGDPNWETNTYADQAIDDFETLDVVYGNYNVLKEKTNDSWQREHAFCASLMTGFTTGEATTNVGRATDFHNLFASLSSGNTSRSNKNYGIADSSLSSYHDPSVLNEYGGDYKCDYLNFEPSNKDKGRLARAIFYMGVMYSKEEKATLRVKSDTKTAIINATYKPLQIIEGVVGYSKITYKDFVDSSTDASLALGNKYTRNEAGYASYSMDNCKFAIGNLSTLLLWNNYSVDRLEVQHNESVYSHVYSTQGVAQGNRNPFVDFPDLVDYVYGSKKDQPGKLEDILSSYDALEMNSKKSDHIAIKQAKRSYSVGETFTTQDYQLVNVCKDGTLVPEDSIATASTHTFIKEDSDNGYKMITLNTSPNKILLRLDVLAGLIEGCDYKVNFSTSNFTDKKIKTTPTSLNETNGVSWLASATNEVSVSKSSGMNAVSIGTSKTYADTLVIETNGAFTFGTKTKIAAIYIQANPASGKTYKCDITIGLNTLSTIKMNYAKPNPDYDTYGEILPVPLEGKITITITNVNAAFNLQNIGIKTA